MRKTVDTRPLFLLGRKRAPRAYKGPAGTERERELSSYMKITANCMGLGGSETNLICVIIIPNVLKDAVR